ncbi:uncharacterized protein V6R79_009789 [Siganus canaliculatus]
MVISRGRQRHRSLTEQLFLSVELLLDDEDDDEDSLESLQRGKPQRLLDGLRNASGLPSALCPSFSVWFSWSGSGVALGPGLDRGQKERQETGGRAQEGFAPGKLFQTR